MKYDEHNLTEKQEKEVLKSIDRENIPDNIYSQIPFMNGIMLPTTQKDRTRKVLTSSGKILSLEEYEKIGEKYNNEFKKEELRFFDEKDSLPYFLPVRAESSYIKKIENDLKKSEISFTKTTFETKDNKKIYSLSFNNKDIPHIQKILSNTINDPHISKTDGIKIDNNEIIRFKKSEYILNKRKVTDKYIEELSKIPEQEKNPIQELLRKVHDSMIKCEMYLGQMKEATIARDENAFAKAKTSLKKEYIDLCQYEKELAKEDTSLDVFEKSVTILAINQLIKRVDKQVEEMTVDNAKHISLLKDQKDKELKTDYFAQHIKAMLDNRENLSTQELLNTIGAADSIHATAKEYKQETIFNKHDTQNVESKSDTLSDLSTDGHTDGHRVDGITNTSKVNVNDILDGSMPDAPRYDFTTPPLEKERTLFPEENE